MRKKIFYILFLVFIALFLGCSDGSQKTNTSEPTIGVNEALKLAENEVSKANPEIISKLVNKKHELINNWEAPGFPERKRQVWHITLLPAEEKYAHGLGMHTYIDAETGKVLESSGHPSFFDGRNKEIAFERTLHEMWKGNFPDEMELEEVQNEEGLSNFFKKFVATQVKVPKIDSEKELVLAYKDQKVEKLYLNGNVLVLIISQDPKWVDVIKVSYKDLPVQVREIRCFSKDNELLRFRQFEDPRY